MLLLNEASPWALIFTNFWGRKMVTAIIKLNWCVSVCYWLLDIATEIINFIALLFSVVNHVLVF